MARVARDLSDVTFYDALNGRVITVIGRQVAASIASPIEWWYCIATDLEPEEEPCAGYYCYLTRRQLEEMEELPQ